MSAAPTASTTVGAVSQFLETLCPPALAESWDNVGLLVGDPARSVHRVMACLTLTPTSVAEAVRAQADLVVTHHPLPFRAVKRITSGDTVGQMLLALIEAKVAVHSPHTAFDSAAEGINQRWAERLHLEGIAPLVPSTAPGVPQEHIEAASWGAGRFGRVRDPISLGHFIDVIKHDLKIETVKVVGNEDRPVEHVALACGSAGEFLEPALAHGCDLLVTGETSFHTCLAAEAGDIALVLTGHYSSERIGVEFLAERIAHSFGGVKVWASADERNPVRFA